MHGQIQRTREDGDDAADDPPPVSAPRGERGWSAKVSLFMREAFLPSLILLPFVSSSRRQNRIRYRVVQFSVYNSGSLHQLLNLLLRKKGKEKERGKEGRGRDRFPEIDIPSDYIPPPPLSPALSPASSCNMFYCSISSLLFLPFLTCPSVTQPQSPSFLIPYSSCLRSFIHASLAISTSTKFAQVFSNSRPRINAIS